MIELSRSSRRSAPAVKFIGLGSAGANVLDRLILDGLDPATAIAMNTDVQALNGSVAPVKVHLGRNTTRGLGAGGDPELGYTSAEEAAEEINSAIEGAGMLFMCAGLGGGTGSGAAPLIAHLARKAGAFVVAFVTMPFQFEGRRRGAQAAEALAQIGEQADLVVCFENDRMGEAVAPTAGIQQAFVAADQTLSQSIRAVAALVQRPGLLSLGLDDLAALLHNRKARSLFGYGESDSSNRAHEALDRALRSTLMDRGRMLEEAQSVLIHITGGPDLTLNEVTALMDEFNRHVSDSAHVHFGVTTDPQLGRRICVAILSSTDAEVPVPAAALPPETKSVPTPAPAPAPEKPARSRPPERKAAAEPDLFAPPVPPTAAAPATVPASEHSDGVPDEVEAPAAIVHPTPAPVEKTKDKAAAAKKEERAEQMALEPVNRGRFEKSEPTIVDGEDLDVPTFLRKNIKMK